MSRTRVALVVAWMALLATQAYGQMTDTLASRLTFAATTRVAANGQEVITTGTIANRTDVPLRLAISVYCPIALRLYSGDKRHSLLWDGSRTLCAQALRLESVAPKHVIKFTRRDSISRMLGDSIRPGRVLFATVFRLRAGYSEVPSGSGSLRCKRP